MPCGDPLEHWASEATFSPSASHLSFLSRTAAQRRCAAAGRMRTVALHRLRSWRP